MTIALSIQILPVDCQRLIWSKVFNACIDEIPKKVKYNKLIKVYEECKRDIERIENELNNDEENDWDDRRELLYDLWEAEIALKDAEFELDKIRYINIETPMEDITFEFDNEENIYLNGYSLIVTEDDHQIDDSDLDSDHEGLILSSDDEL